VHLVGETDKGKTTLALLTLQHFGSGLDDQHIPANWSSTENALEALAFTAKDSLLVIDDFVACGSQYDSARLHRKADRVFRAQGNSTGRQRLTSDSELKGGKKFVFTGISSADYSYSKHPRWKSGSAAAVAIGVENKIKEHLVSHAVTV
tara:strand:- start:174 stop:620 length:447 start_codon:yes stop_codon:yes gene_type:complete